MVQHPSSSAEHSSDGRIDLVVAACRYIEHNEQPPTLAELAAHVGLSASHFQKLFKAHTGVTPKAYADAHRARRLRGHLADGNSVTDAMYAAGFASSGRLYEAADSLLGMTPSSYRQKGKAQDIRFAVGQSTLGAVLVAASARGICAIWLGDEPQALVQTLQERFSAANLIGADPEFEQWVAQVVGFVEQPHVGLHLPLDIRGTAFQQRVWQALREIPAGQTVSYTDIAQRIGSPQSVRAVAGACAANLLAVAIPCHRVVRNDGGLSGYRWGVERKAALLAREAQGASGELAM